MCTCALHMHVHTLRTDELTSGLGGRRTSVCAGRHVLPGRPTSSYASHRMAGLRALSLRGTGGNGRPSIPACHSKPIISPLTTSCEKNHLHPVHMGSKQFHKNTRGAPGNGRCRPSHQLHFLFLAALPSSSLSLRSQINAFTCSPCDSLGSSSVVGARPQERT